MFERPWSPCPMQRGKEKNKIKTKNSNVAKCSRRHIYLIPVRTGPEAAILQNAPAAKATRCSGSCVSLFESATGFVDSH